MVAYMAAAHRLGLLGLAAALLALAVATVAAASPARSTSWAGYQAAAAQGFRTVSASWTVTQASCGSVAGKGDADSYTWAGLGSGATSERAGVREFCTGGIPTYTAYIELNNLYEVQAFTPAAGDQVTASVSYRSGRYTFRLTDSTKGKSFSHAYACGAFSQGAGTCNRNLAQVGAGIWAPARSPLTDYATISFRGITVTSALGKAGSFTASRDRTINSFAEANGGKLAATPSTLTARGTAFTDTWRSS